MSMKARGKNLETKVARGSRTAGRDVKKGMSRVATGAKTVGRDVERAGKKVAKSTRSGMTRAHARLKVTHRSKARST
jgi:hypothetical protein